MRKRVEDWVVPDAVEITMLLFKSHLEEQLKKFNSLVHEWEEVISKDIGMRRAVLVNAPGNMKGYAISYVCRKAGVPLIASQHGVTLEISKSRSSDNGLSVLVIISRISRPLRIPSRSGIWPLKA